MIAHLFGPVPSRRLGRSLGVDLVPFKTCTYDCIYCQLGRTTCKTTERKEWVPFDELLTELPRRLASKPDYITLSGSGEPTLYSRIGQLIARIKSMTDIPVAVLTNGSLLWIPEVRSQLLEADVLIPSLDAGNDATFQAVNRPVAQISFRKMLDGLIAMRQDFRGDYWLELMIVPGYTASPAAIQELAGHADTIQPDRIQLNTVTRPPADSTTAAASLELLETFRSFFHPPAEVIAQFRSVHQDAEFTRSRADVLELLRRRPASLADIAHGLGAHENEVIKYVEELLRSGEVDVVWRDGQRYYRGINAT